MSGVTLEGKRFGLPYTDDVDVLVFIGGFPDDHGMWKHQIDAFGGSYHIISISTPDFDRGALRRRWGYTPSETATLIRACIENALGATRPFTMVTHDWGAYWGYLYIGGLIGDERKRVLKLIALDVGADAKGGPTPEKPPAKPEHPGTRGALWSLPYQWWFALSFWVGVRISASFAEIMLRFFRNVAWSLVGPLGWGFDWQRHMPRPVEEVKWWMTWPYWQVWCNYALRGRMPPSPEFPYGIPTLFVYGERKRAFFHSGNFVARLESTPGCRAIGYENCGHWVMWEEAERLNRDISAFLEE